MCKAQQYMIYVVEQNMTVTLYVKHKPYFTHKSKNTILKNH